MARRKKPQPAPAIIPQNDPTAERQRRDDFAVIAAPRGVDERIGRDALKTTRQRVSRVVRMEAGENPWLDKRGAVALEHYSVLIERAGYDAGCRGCLSTASGNGEFEAISDLHFEARERLKQAADAIAKVDQIALQLVNALLSPLCDETTGSIARRLLRGGLVEARDRVRTAASAVAEHFTHA